MSKELKFSDIKDDLSNLIEGVVKKNLDGKSYDNKEARSWASTITNDNIRSIDMNQRQFNYNQKK